MTLSLITNVVFAALVLLAIPGMLVWAIRTSRNDSPPRPRRHALRRPTPHSSFTGTRLSSGYGRRETRQASAQDAG
jgi:hypothetical protein